MFTVRKTKNKNKNKNKLTKENKKQTNPNTYLKTQDTNCFLARQQKIYDLNEVFNITFLHFPKSTHINRLTLQSEISVR